ncbi:MAG: CHAT domain-containing protein [Thainema sp.]
MVRWYWRLLRFPRWCSSLLLALMSLTVALVLPAISTEVASQAIVRPALSEFAFSEMANIAQLASDPVEALDQGLMFYQAGQYAEALNYWQAARAGFQQRGDRLNTALALSYLSLVQQQLGDFEAAERAIATSLEHLNQGSLDQASQQILAHALNTQASLYLAQSNAESAYETWQVAADAYRATDDQAGVLGSKLNQAQALQTLGLYRQARALLRRLGNELQDSPASLVKATGLRQLGSALYLTGNIEQANEILLQSLALSQQFGDPLLTSSVFYDLGQASQIAGDWAAALDFYQQSAQYAPTALAQMEARVAFIKLLIETQQWELVQPLIPNLLADLGALPASRQTVYLRVNAAAMLLQTLQTDPEPSSATLEADAENFATPIVLTTPEAIAQNLEAAVQLARQLQDERAQSLALGQLGQVYELTEQWEFAERLTAQALMLAELNNSPEIAYRWQWQQGRIFRAQSGRRADAIASYSAAVKTLREVRQDLVATNAEFQFSFRDTVEPVYRDLVDLLIQLGASEADLRQAQDTFEELQVAELENFFRSACLDTAAQRIDQIDSQAAIFYPIVLPDRVEVVLSVPNQPLQHHTVALTAAEVETQLDQYLQSLNPVFSNEQRLNISAQIYDWLIRPFEPQLAEHQVLTLVFVLDGTLRNAPMAALYDGEHYLVEKYRIAFTPGLQLLRSQSLAETNLQVLVGGITEARQGFAALPGVVQEVEQISTTLPSRVVLNEQFTRPTITEQLNANDYPIVHFATHGRFSSNPRETFLLSWEEPISVQEFDQLLGARQIPRAKPIELLVLSACETAAGDRRAALGLAGLAIRSGARSTLATLWSVNDQSTAQFMADFYKILQDDSQARGEVLRQAQLRLLNDPQYQHPYYWAPFVLVGSWT